MIKTVLSDVLVTQDGGRTCWDTTISAADIVRMLDNLSLRYDPAHQRNSADKGVSKRRVAHWADRLLDGTAIFGQLTWNFRPDTATIRFIPTHADVGLLEIEGIAYVPDSWHRTQAIRRAAERVEKNKEFGRDSKFNPSQRFSLRIWNVPEEFEDTIFYAMNQEGQKASASRSKTLHQGNIPQKIAHGFVTRSPHLLGDGADNVEIYRNMVSANSHRLTAFNTISTALENNDVWRVTDETQVKEVVTWLVAFWDKLAENVPEVRHVGLEERQFFRGTSIAGSAVAIHGYLGLAWEMYRRQTDLSVLDRLSEDEFFNLDNPQFENLGIVVPSERNKSGYATRNSRVTQGAMTKLLIAQVGL